MTDLLSDISNSSIFQNGVFNSKTVSHEHSFYYSGSQRRLTFYKRTLMLSPDNISRFKHLSNFQIHEFLNRIYRYQNGARFLDLTSQMHFILLQLRKLYDQCSFMASREISNVSEHMKAGQCDQHCMLCDGLESIKCQLSFVRNICEQITVILKQPWILKSKKVQIPKCVSAEIENLFGLFLRKFVRQLNSIIKISAAIILSGLQRISVSSFQDCSDSEFFNLGRGLEEFTKISLHIKTLNQLSLIRCVVSKSTSTPFADINTIIDTLCFEKDISVRNVVKVISNTRSRLMAERIYRFFFQNKDVFKAIRYRYLFQILQPKLFSNEGDFGLDSYRSSSQSSRSLFEEIVQSSEGSGERKYRKFVQRLSSKMKHTTLAEEMKNEYQFIVLLLESIFKSTDLLEKQHKAAHKRSISRSSNLNSATGASASGAGYREKTVGWRDSHDTLVKNRFVRFYKDRYLFQVDDFLDVIESSFCDHHQDRLGSSNSSKSMSNIGPFMIHNSAIKMALSTLIKEPSIMHQFPSELKPCLHNQSVKMQLSARFIIANKVFCLALGYSHDDRFFGGQNCSNACREFLKGLIVIEKGLEEVDIESGLKYVVPIVEKYFTLSSTISSAIVVRTQLKFQRIISSWNLSAFMFLLFADTKMLILQLENIFNFTKTIANSCKDEPLTMLRKSFVNLDSNMRKMKTIYEKMQETLRDKIKRSIEMCLSDEFPEDKMWLEVHKMSSLETEKQASQESAEYQPNKYIESILAYNISPIANSLSYLDRENEKKAIALIIEIVVSSLMEYVYERKLKLSFIGACHLESDINYLLKWLQRFLEAEVFDYVNNRPLIQKTITILKMLKRQHCFDKSRPNAYPKLCSSVKAVKVEDSFISGNGFQNLFSNDVNDGLGNLKDWLKLRAYPIESNVVHMNSCL